MFRIVGIHVFASIHGTNIFDNRTFMIFGFQNFDYRSLANESFITRYISTIT